ncbi:MAG: serine/threonine protein kinase [Myxococcales bacterium]|nr:serine/threonine protein kinase [Myxococcales bacterium]
MAGTDPMLGVQAQVPSVVVDSDPLIGLNLGGFVVKKLLASGGMGLVYEALHEQIGRRAAVKVLKPEVAADQEWTRRFLTEAQALASLKNKNLIEVLNFGKTPDGREFLMMEFLEGEALDGYISRMGALTPAVALGLTEQILNALSEAHKKGVVHRDLKPSNVFLLREHSGELLVKVIDFGLARQEPVKLLDAALALPKAPDGASLLAGTPEYIAPEQAQGRKVDHAADLYSLGIMLFEMLSGSLPFAADSVTELLQQHLSAKPPKLSSQVNNLPEGFDELVDALLEKDPAKRPSSADAARVQVQRLLKRLAMDSTAVRVDPKHVPTIKIDRSKEPVPEVVPPAGAAPKLQAQSPTTDLALQKAIPRRGPGVWIGLGAGVLALLAVGWWASTPAEVPAEPTPPVAAALPPEPPEPSPSPEAPPKQPDPVEEPQPLPTVVKSLEPTKAKRPEKVAVEAAPEASACANLAQWKAGMKRDVTELENSWLSKHPEHEAAWNAALPVVSAYAAVVDLGGCVKVQRRFDQFKRQVGLPLR